MNKVFYVYESFDMGGRSYIARNSKAVNNREAVSILNDMYEALLEISEMDSSELAYMNENSSYISELLKRARGE